MPRCSRRKTLRCRHCGAALPTWLPVLGRPDGPMLLLHLGAQHPDEFTALQAQMHMTADIAKVAAQAFDLVEAL